MRISGYLMGLVVGLFLATAGTIIISQFVAEQPSFVVHGSDTTVYRDFNASFTKYAELESDISDLENKLNSTGSSNALEFTGALFRTGYNAIQVMFGSFGLMGDMFNAAQTTFGIDSRLVAFGMMAITLIIIVALLAAIFQTDV